MNTPASGFRQRHYIIFIDLMLDVLAHIYIVFTDCGVNVVQEGRIVGGEDVDGTILPWYALLHPPEDKTIPVCSGTLIDSNHVITAAHCFTL
jgi:secreted trypsin-like serine protease